MSELRQKHPRLRLKHAAYAELHQRVLRRDGWRCQQCGRSDNLEVHHIRARSKLGNDAEDNLITLCADCHQSVHLSGRKELGS
jgi:5-methylcytosine-specific restriction endonuclease McrA